MYEKVKDSTPPRLVHVEQRGGVANCVRLLVSIHARRPIFVRYGGAVCGYGYCWPVPGLSCAPDRARRAGNRYDSCELAVCLRTEKSTTTCSVFQDRTNCCRRIVEVSGRWLLASIVLESIIVQDTRIASVLYQAACIAVQCTCGSSSSVRICPGIADCGFGFAGLVLMLDPCTSRYVRVYEYSGQRSVHQQIFVRFVLVRLLIVYSFMTGECRPLLWGLRTRAPCLLPGTFYFARSKSIRSAAFRPLI